MQFYDILFFHQIFTQWTPEKFQLLFHVCFDEQTICQSIWIFSVDIIQKNIQQITIEIQVGFQNKNRDKTFKRIDCKTFEWRLSEEFKIPRCERIDRCCAQLSVTSGLCLTCIIHIWISVEYPVVAKKWAKLESSEIFPTLATWTKLTLDVRFCWC